MTTEAITKPSTNGTLKFARRGIVKVQFGDDGHVFEVDIVRVYDEFNEMEWEFCDADGKIVGEKRNAWRTARHNFVQVLVNEGHQGKSASPPNLTRAESNDFIARMIEEVNSLRPFSKPNSGEKPSSPESTDIRFSQ